MAVTRGLWVGFAPHPDKPAAGEMCERCGGSCFVEPDATEYGSTHGIYYRWCLACGDEIEFRTKGVGSLKGIIGYEGRRKPGRPAKARVGV